ncbi:DHH family phosphoesterase [Leadbettera azotonutricia]|uniref:DHH family protein n=1 Tax=Leadbettera azotonutricia (strain ATCC BAA-888 / DSM 13862 / ZAS-9) TaxID=545695 RepID=F5Y8I4_LEAAZ|nr:bifunctional oligoribonuclease/PAP phosphatase NrnA [Leadbettera azotonutricia]AEF83208.1 DHH family protein [Leadbettera azotonutricia ZAS-9]
MQEEIFEFLKRHSSLVLTTHEGPDADGLGAEIVFSQICREMGKKIRIINSGPTPERFVFIDPNEEIEVWDKLKEDIPKKSALVILDTSDEYNIGKLKEFIPEAAEVFFIDHHEPNSFSALKGYTDRTASSACELVVEIAAAAGVKLNLVSASAAYAGIVYDSGSFAYSKTTIRTFRASLVLVEAGVNPYHIYHELNESASTASLLLQRQVLSTLRILNRGRVAVQIMRKEDLDNSGASFEDAEPFINVPLKSRDIMVSVLVKQNQEGQGRCSLRSKGEVNVSKIAQSFGGGGHVSAAGFKSKDSIEDTLAKVLAKIDSVLETLDTQ